MVSPKKDKVGRRKRDSYNDRNKNMKIRRVEEEEEVKEEEVQIKEEEEEDIVLVTPHIKRLLKLIQEGASCSSTNHARMAASHLTALTATGSPLLLWDILGRLQAFLMVSSSSSCSYAWSCRQHASWAIEGVAQHLPPKDQRDFLMNVRVIIMQQQQQQQHNVLWLTTDHVLKHFDTIMKQGRLLMAIAEKDHLYQNDEFDEETQLQQIDQHQQPTNDFVQQRIMWQRRILAKRLGLAGLLNAIGTASSSSIGDQLLPNTITTDDLLLNNNNIMPGKREQDQSTTTTTTTTTTTKDHSIRALLVMEVMKQEQHSSLLSLSHHKPQTLLATELLYRMFDPRWELRHGALLGILALLKAWQPKASSKQSQSQPQTQQPTSSSINQDPHHHHHCFGAWPHDLLARSLCIIGLDRFADYGDGSIVAPVREMACQVLVVLYRMAPTHTQQTVHQILYRFSSYTHDWEPRHGAMLAFSYLLVAGKIMPTPTTITNTNTNNNNNTDLTALRTNITQHNQNQNQQNAHVCWEFMQRAIEGLSDSSVDVKSAAAKVLMVFLLRQQQNSKQNRLEQQQQQQHDSLPNCAMFQDQIIQKAILPVWETIASKHNNQKDNFLFCGGSNVIKLFAKMVCCDCDQVFQVLSIEFSTFLEKLVDLLSFPSSDIHCSTLDSIASLLQSTYAIQKSTTQSIGSSFFNLTTKLYESFWALNEDWVDDAKISQKLQSSRDNVWTQVVEYARKVFVMDEGSPKKLIMSLLFLYTGLHDEDNHSSHNDPDKDSKRDFKLTTLEKASEALAKLIDIFSVDSDGDSRVLPSVDACTKLLCMSPLHHHFEAASLLVRSMGRQPGPSIVHSLPETFQLFTHMLQHKDIPFCVRGDSIVREDIKLKTLYRKTIYRCLQETMLLNNQPQSPTTSSIDISSLNSTLRSGGTEVDSILSMRVSSRIAGTIVASGKEGLPVKLTPLIRPLMTALRSETNKEQVELVCQDLARLLVLLSPSSSIHIRNKLLGNVCKLVAMSRFDSEEIQVESAINLVKLFVSTHCDEVDFVSIPAIWDLIGPFASDPSANGEDSLCGTLKFMLAVFSALSQSGTSTHLIHQCMPSLILVSCRSIEPNNREQALQCVKILCRVDTKECIQQSLPVLVKLLDSLQSTPIRIGASKVLCIIVNTAEMEICPYVMYLLPIAMSLMTDPVEMCSREATSLFSVLVRVAPFVKETANTGWDFGPDDHSSAVVEHLVRGNPLPVCSLPEEINLELEQGGIKLRGYQEEGVSWLAFLKSVNLNGALCDEMGLGKTLQALIAIALAHHKEGSSKPVRSIVICPSTVVGHWVAEIAKCFPSGKSIAGFAFTGNAKQRKQKWNMHLNKSNVVVTSYTVLRTEASNLLGDQDFCYCILDEGHLLKNPKTATAIAARKIRAKHKLILTGTPVQNQVSELWATFDFLMPNFLGSHASFSKLYGNPIGKGQQPGANADAIANGIEKLKFLHQQVLPFILRREKQQVLKELPPKCISDIPCELTPSQESLYKAFCSGIEAQQALTILQKGLDEARDPTTTAGSVSIGTGVLRSLMYLRLICTHPLMVEERIGTVWRAGAASGEMRRSGKLMVLRDLLRTAGICAEDPTAADNDASVFFACEEDEESPDPAEEVLSGADTVEPPDLVGPTQYDAPITPNKCLIFAQFTQSLDIVEKYLFTPHMPSLRFLRLDGNVPHDKRAAVVSAFNNDDSIKVMLLTTRVGGLGLNLTGASKVIFLEHDYNPHVDLQAMDRAHRIGQTRAVDIYRLITNNTVEEKIMALQKVKLRMSEAIVNSENSSMYSMGTDKLLDIFTFNTGDESSKRKRRQQSKTDISHMDAFYENNEYESLSVKSFLKGFTT